jgi:hypothetical protein
MPNNITDIEDFLPYTVSEVICVFCCTRFICGRPEELLLKNLKCHGCGKMGGIIETGEIMDKVEGQYNGEVIDYTRKIR